LAQQILLGASTYCIALAGSAVAQSDTQTAVQFVVYFFVFALLAFVASVGASIAAEKCRNLLIDRYSQFFQASCENRSLIDTSENRSTAVSWLVGEAPGTIDELVGFVLDAVETFLNVSITLFVFGVVLGWQLSVTIALTLMASALLIILTRAHIARLGNLMQETRLASNRHAVRYWNGVVLASGPLKDAIVHDHQKRLYAFFSHRLVYRTWEQIGAAVPIILAVIALIGYVSVWATWSGPALGAAVAVLPRALQLLGSAHSISIFASQYYMYSAKFSMLRDFWIRLNEHDPALSITWSSVRVVKCDTGELWSAEDLVGMAREGKLKCGRILITGPNGSGKSSVLRILRGAMHDVVYFDPHTDYVAPEDIGRSSGQKQVANLELIFATDCKVLLLDEWDANLDWETADRMSGLIDLMAGNRVVVEVRHRAGASSYSSHP
jgi:ABC-type multidrug transport system fused ATPase/permease subunit